MLSRKFLVVICKILSVVTIIVQFFHFKLKCVIFDKFAEKLNYTKKEKKKLLMFYIILTECYFSFHRSGHHEADWVLHENIQKWQTFTTAYRVLFQNNQVGQKQTHYCYILWTSRSYSLLKFYIQVITLKDVVLIKHLWLQWLLACMPSVFIVVLVIVIDGCFSSEHLLLFQSMFKDEK